MSLLLPWGLLALAALALPILVHCLRRRDIRRLDFAALRWVGARGEPRRRPRWQERGLMAWRMLLLALLALALARPWLYAPAAAARPWALAAPGVAPALLAQWRAREPERDWRWLAPGFPSLDAARPPAEQAWFSLLREADARLPAGSPLLVLVPATLQGLDGELPRMARPLRWQVLAGAAPATAKPAPRRVVLRYAPERQAVAAYVAAAVAAWNAAEPGRYRFEQGPAGRALPADTDWLIGLGPAPAGLAARLRPGGTALFDDGPAPAGLAYDAAHRLWRGADHGVQRVHLASPLAPAHHPELLSGEFPARLKSWLAAPAAPASADASSVRPLAAARPPEHPGEALQPALAWALALVFLVERLWATRAGRGRL